MNMVVPITETGRARPRSRPLAAKGRVRGRERPRLSVTGTIMFMAFVSPLLPPSMSQAGLAVKATSTMTIPAGTRTKGIHPESTHNILSPRGHPGLNP